MDKDGYPEENELQKIREWDYVDFTGLMEYLEDLGFKNYGTIKNFLGMYYISTGGWSGNESIIDAMEDNTMLWNIHWYSSRVGGHYQFEKRTFK